MIFEDSLVMIVRHRLSLRRTGNNVFSALNGSASNHNNTIARLFPHESINGYIILNSKTTHVYFSISLLIREKIVVKL